MTKFNCVNLETFMETFGELEQKITEVKGKSSMLEIMLEDANRLMKFHISKEKSLNEEKDGLLHTVKGLQQTLQEQCNLRVENERLKNDIMVLKQQNERAAEAGETDIQRLLSQMRVEEGRHQRELEVIRHQCSGEVEDARRKALSEVVARDAEVKKLLEEKDEDLEAMKTRLVEQEREKQTELLKLQMEFGAKLARVQSTAQRNQQQQQPQGSNLLPQSVFKRKLQFFQEEKNKEISALRQRIKELEETRLSSSLSDIRLKRRKI